MEDTSRKTLVKQKLNHTQVITASNCKYFQVTNTNSGYWLRFYIPLETK